MKLFDQPYIPLPVLSVYAKLPNDKDSIVLGQQQKVSDDSKVGQDQSAESGRSSQYPMATDEQLHNRDKRKAFSFFKPKPPKPVTPPKSKPPQLSSVKPSTPKPVKPTSSKPAGGPNGANEAVNSLKTINSLHTNNVFPPLSSQLAASARHSFLSAGVSTLINLPFSVGEHMASKAIMERLDVQAKMPGAEKKNADGTTSTNDPSATEKQKLEARLEGAEIKTEVMVNTLLSINSGPDAKAVGKDPNAATDVDSRLNALESRMTATEDQMKEIATRYGLIYEPYVAPQSSQAPTETSRMQVIENRYAHMNKMLKRLIRNAEADAEDAE